MANPLNSAHSALKGAAVALAIPLLPELVLVAVVLLVLWYINKNFGAGSRDAGGAVQPNASLLDGAINSSLEVGHSPLSYTDAAGQVLIHPIDSLYSIFGIGQN